MPGYTILFSSSTRKPSSEKNIIDKDSPKIKEINSVLRDHFKHLRYDCHLDELMLFSVNFQNFKKGIYYNGMYVISLVEINHPLFITNSALEILLDSNHTISTGDIRSVVPSYRFNKLYIGDYFYLDESNTILFNSIETNSHGLVRRY
jgi:hypothetical protein